MNDQQLYALAYRDLWPFYRALVGASPGARLLELDGLLAAITPTVPDKSILNGVIYESGEALRDTYERLASEYEQAGISAWMAWVPGHDEQTASALEQAGHKLDAAPAAMALELNGWQPPDISAFTIERTDDIRAVAALNDHAYGYTEPAFEKGITRMPEDMFIYAIRGDDGAIVSCVSALDDRGDCGIYMVATHAEARGRGLAGALMSHALIEAKQRGCKTTSLQASQAGYSVYRKLGYKDLGTIGMWERRAEGQ